MGVSTLFAVALLVIVSKSIAEPANICPPPFLLRNGECFLIQEDLSEKLDWIEARQRCLSLGGDLAHPNEKDAFVSYIGGLPVGTVPVWLGATNNNKENKWKWLSGENVSNTTWLNSPHFPEGDRLCLNVNYHYNIGFWVSAMSCMEKATYVCKFVPGKISSISRKSFTHSSLEVDWISPPGDKQSQIAYTLKWNQLQEEDDVSVSLYNVTSSLMAKIIPPPISENYYTSYTLKWLDVRTQVEQMTTIDAPPYNITGLTPCTDYIITVIPHMKDSIRETNNTVSMATRVNGEFDGYTTIAFDGPYSVPWIAYYNRMTLGSCKSECSRQEACTYFSFKNYRNYGCIFYDAPVPKYTPIDGHDSHDLIYMKQGCSSL